MKRSTISGLRMAVLAAFICIGDTAAAEETVLFSDSFADVKGHVIGQSDGKISKGGEAATRRLLPFMGVSPLANGKLTIVAFEDSVTAGFDGKPGVLAISLTSVPNIASYCGFAYLGGLTRERALTLQEVVADPNLDNLKRIKLRFRFKALNTMEASAVGASYGCRLEPLVENSYAARIAFGVIRATNEWQLFESTLDQGENLENFLKSVSTDKPAGFKIIWCQAGSITNYQVGDTLLIDDIEITQTTR